MQLFGHGQWTPDLTMCIFFSVFVSLTVYCMNDECYTLSTLNCYEH